MSTYEICAQPSIFHKSIEDEIQKAPNGYDFDLYVFITALINGFVPLRFPVLFPRRTHGSSHWNINIISKLIFIRKCFGLNKNIFKKVFKNNNEVVKIFTLRLKNYVYE